MEDKRKKLSKEEKTELKLQREKTFRKIKQYIEEEISLWIDFLKNPSETEKIYDYYESNYKDYKESFKLLNHIDSTVRASKDYTVYYTSFKAPVKISKKLPTNLDFLAAKHNLIFFSHKSNQAWKNKDFNHYLNLQKEVQKYYQEIFILINIYSLPEDHKHQALSFYNRVGLSRFHKRFSDFSDERSNEYEKLKDYKELISKFYDLSDRELYKETYDWYGQNRSKFEFILNDDQNKKFQEILEIAVLHLKKDVKNLVLELSTRFTRLEIREIGEKCGITHDELIATVLREMIQNKEIYAEYFSSSKSIAFDQMSNLREIDNLMENFNTWEQGAFKKK